MAKHRTKTRIFEPAMSRVIIQALCRPSARPLPRLHSFRSLAPLSTAHWAPATAFCSPMVPARTASTSKGSNEPDFDIDDVLPSAPPSSSKPPAPPPNPYPETTLDVPASGTDWSRSYTGLSTEPFPKEMAEILMAPVDPMDVEMKPGSFMSHNAHLRSSVNHHLYHRWTYLPSGD